MRATNLANLSLMMQLRSPLDALSAEEASAHFDQESRAALSIATDHDVTVLLHDAGATLAPLAAAAETLRDLDIPSAHAIYQGIARLGAILRRLGAPPGPRAVDVNFVVASVVALFRSLSRTVRVATRLEEPLPLVSVDPLTLERALLALLIECADSVVEENAILLTTTAQRTEARVLLQMHGVRRAEPNVTRLRDAIAGAGGDVRIESCDDGKRIVLALPIAARRLRAVAHDDVITDVKPDVAHVLVFDPFRLDVTNETLWRGDAKLYLRAKPFTILRYLAEHPRRLVTQDELLLGAWGNVVRSDSLLRTHIRGLRQVLGRGIIETVIGRGYRFAIDVARVVERGPLQRGPSRCTLA